MTDWRYDLNCICSPGAPKAHWPYCPRNGRGAEIPAPPSSDPSPAPRETAGAVAPDAALIERLIAFMTRAHLDISTTRLTMKRNAPERLLTAEREIADGIAEARAALAEAEGRKG